jgi:hypothetical protein
MSDAPARDAGGQGRRRLRRRLAGTSGRAGGGGGEGGGDLTDSPGCSARSDCSVAGLAQMRSNSSSARAICARSHTCAQQLERAQVQLRRRPQDRSRWPCRGGRGWAGSTCRGGASRCRRRSRGPAGGVVAACAAAGGALDMGALLAAVALAVRERRCGGSAGGARTGRASGQGGVSQGGPTVGGCMGLKPGAHMRMRCSQSPPPPPRPQARTWSSLSATMMTWGGSLSSGWGGSAGFLCVPRPRMRMRAPVSASRAFCVAPCDRAGGRTVSPRNATIRRPPPPSSRLSPAWCARRTHALADEQPQPGGLWVGPRDCQHLAPLLGVRRHQGVAARHVPR